jgi:hypothetical protein
MPFYEAVGLAALLCLAVLPFVYAYRRIGREQKEGDSRYKVDQSKGPGVGSGGDGFFN